jgi:SAM-dependent methyltransferase
MGTLRGRYIIDRIKRLVSSRFTMPVPPYGDPLFWENVYQKMETATASNTSQPPTADHVEVDDAFEWGGIHLQDILEYDYKPITLEQQYGGEYASKSFVANTVHRTTFGETLGVHPTVDSTTMDNNSKNKLLGKEQPVLMLGCGNSRMGEDMIDFGWRGPIIQVDIAAKALELISRRSRHDSSRLQFVHDDAAHLSSIRKSSIFATVDKGLLDALFCANDHELMADVMKSVSRVLRPGGVFCVFSFSRPEFILPRLIPLKMYQSIGLPRMQSGWEGLQMQELDNILIYRFQKNIHGDDEDGGFREPKIKKRRR